MSFASDELAAAQADDFIGRLKTHPKTGTVAGSLLNVTTILDEHPHWKGCIGLDRFSGRILKRREPPSGGGLGEWADIDDSRATLWMSREFGLEPKPDVLVRAVDVVAENNAFHVVRDYLRTLTWDGKPRVQTAGWLCVYLGAPETDYHRIAGMRWLISAVARVMHPPCKADHVLILEGLQGLGKSTSLKVLFGDWFTDSSIRIGDREAAMVLRGVWGAELGELDSLNRAESTAAKQFFSQQDDRYRSPWGRRPQTVPRQCVFSGSTNQTIYLKDDTGNRRYWPIECTRADLEELRADRDQIWAEAVHLFDRGEAWHPLLAERKLFEAEQEKRMIRDAIEERIRDWLEQSVSEGRRKRVTMSEILGGALNLDAGKWTRVEQTRVGQVLSRIDGWRHRQVEIIEGATKRRIWVYERHETK